jgi:hypothetical protein
VINIGLDEKQINIMLGREGFFTNDLTSANEIKKAISFIVTENNKAIDDAIKTYFVQHNNVHHKY